MAKHRACRAPGALQLRLIETRMNEDLYAQKLAWFKQNEQPEAVLLVADNPERIKIVIAWTNLNVRRAEKLTELTSESENEVWNGSGKTPNILGRNLKRRSASPSPNQA